MYFGRTAILVVAMQCVFCVFWQDSDINVSDVMCVFLWPDNDNNSSDAVRVLCILATQRYQLQQCNVWFLWPDNDINGSDAVRVLCILAGQRYQL